MTKKICHITSVHPRYDGRIFRKMCVSLANNGYDVTLLVIDNKPDEVKDGVHIIPIDKQFKNSFDRIFNSWKFLYKKKLWKLMPIYIICMIQSSYNSEPNLNKKAKKSYL